jgi:hypothetical protein
MAKNLVKLLAAAAIVVTAPVQANIPPTTMFAAVRPQSEIFLAGQAEREEKLLGIAGRSDKMNPCLVEAIFDLYEGLGVAPGVASKAHKIVRQKQHQTCDVK